MLKEVTKVRRNFCPLHTWMTITLTFCLQLEWKSEPFCNATMEESFPYHSNHSIICHAFRHSLLQDYKCKCLWHKFIATEKTTMYSNLISVFFFLLCDSQIQNSWELLRCASTRESCDKISQISPNYLNALFILTKKNEKVLLF